MSEQAVAIAPLTKVTLSLEAKPAHQVLSDTHSSVDFEFIFGIGTEGLTGFEAALIGKNEGDRMKVSIDQHGAAVFEHLWNPLVQAIQTPPPFDLHLEVQTVVPANDRELVQALSRKVDQYGCGGGCDCGCGC